MTSQRNERARRVAPSQLWIAGGLAVCGLLLGATQAVAGISFSGRSDTLVRVRPTVDEKTVVPAYEYLNLSLSQHGPGGSLAIDVGGWGRIDLGEEDSAIERGAGDLQYGYLSYRSKTSNFALNVGRQLVSEGVAIERIDGVSLHSDLLGGLGMTAFFGGGTDLETNVLGADTVFGGRLSHGVPGLYTLGVSMTKADREGDNLREAVGGDLWLHPGKDLELIGRSSYNNLSKGWMEHAYTLVVSAGDDLSLAADLQSINYRDYFAAATTSALWLKSGGTGTLDPDEKLLAAGGSLSWRILSGLTLDADYKNYAYELAGSADYFGGGLGWAPAESFRAGCSYHRMDGETAKLSYDEYRLYLAKQFDALDLTLDLYDVRYDEKLNDISNSYAVTLAAAYELAEELRLSADLDYGRNPDYEREIKGLVRLTYAFAKEGAE